MISLRRIYLYCVSLLGLAALGFSLWAVLGEAIRLRLTPLNRPTFGPLTLWLGIALVALIVWAAHRFLAERAARPLTMAGAAERGSASRKAYLYSGQTLALAALIYQAWSCVREALQVALGQPAATLSQWPTRPLALLAGGLLALIFWGGLRRTAVRDGDFGHEIGGARGWRRAYFTVAALGFGVLTAWGAGEFLRTALRLGGQAFLSGIPSGTDWRLQLARPVAAFVVAAAGLLFTWGTANRIAAAAPAVEVNTLGRRLLFFGWLLAGKAVTLVSLAFLLWVGFMLFLGQPIGGAQAVWERLLVLPLAVFPVGLVTWLASAGAIRRDNAWGGEGQDAAALRRVVAYLAAAAGLAALWFGFTELLRLVAPVVLGLGAGGGLLNLENQARFSLAAVLMLIGAPVWWGHWWPQQARARRPEAEGDAERASPIRQVYLYVAVLAAAVIVFFAAGLAIYRVATAPAAALPLALVGAGVMAGLALFWGIVHAVALRGDQRLAAASRAAARVEASTQELRLGRETEPGQTGPSRDGAAQPPTAEVAGPKRFLREELPSASQALQAVQSPQPGPAAPAPVRPVPIFAVVDGGDGKVGAAVVAALRQAASAAVVWPVGLNAAAQVVMLEALGGGTPPAVPADALARVTAIIAASDVLAAGGLDGEVSAELAAAVAASPAVKLLLPPRSTRLRWVAAPDWPVEQWVEYAVSEAAALAA